MFNSKSNVCSITVLMKDFLAKQQFWVEIFYFEHGTVLKKTHSHFIHVHVDTVCPETVVILKNSPQITSNSTQQGIWHETRQWLMIICTVVLTILLRGCFTPNLVKLTTFWNNFTSVVNCSDICKTIHFVKNQFYIYLAVQCLLQLGGGSYGQWKIEVKVPVHLILQKAKVPVFKIIYNLGCFLLKVTVDLRGVYWGKQYSALCINGKYINLYIIGELI